ncbi:thiol reductant ABC exporter subunit CydC [Falsarthrobacter nasiphocae]|uniref:ATP-binding cassette subfamily C protein CydCD n=1 Tax=Falsarthrobacter nasiphocae TaxID=189863 RepID=A0AAE3YFK0_9MICC|nr:thiol reductant ABC exporter subunit CydC [Falsarthrobacter nasiphocae]MDR6891275.1 ATP-binding cassette subfamily C protein CydCD [Falsarthrobacter nasiphocae]
MAAAAARSVGIIALAEALARGLGLVGRADMHTILLLAAAGAGLRGLAAWATPWLASRAAADVAATHRRRLLEARLERPHAQGDIADVSLAGRGMRDLTPYFSQFIPAAVNSAVVPIFLLARIAFADLPSAIAVAVTLPLVPVFMILIGKYTAHRTADLSQAIRTLTDSVAELARGLAVLVSLGQAGRQRRGLERVSGEYTRKVMQSLKVAFLSSLALELIATMSVALVAVIIGIRLLSGDITLYAGLVALIIAPECYTPLREVGAAYHAAEDGQHALKRARGVLSESGPASRAADARIGASGAASPGAAPAQAGARAEGAEAGPASGWRIRGDLYRGERLLAPRLDLSIPTTPGLTAVVGPSGRGKSSLLAILTGLEAGQHAEAPRLDGDGTGPESLSVPQAPAFTEDTVRAELALYVGAAASLVPVARPLGLESLLDAPTSTLSPGEQRRLALARALLAAARRPGVPLVLDEPTSQLDGDNAAAVTRLLAEAAQERRVVVATHDLALAALAGETITIGGPSGDGSDTAPDEAGPGAHRPAETPTAAAEAPAAGGEAAGDGSDAHPQAGQPDKASTGSRAVPIWRERKVLLGVFLGIVSAGCAAALTALSGWLIVRASQQPAIMYLSVAIVGVRAFGLFRAVARYGERLATHEGMLSASASLRLRLWDALATSPAHWRSISRRDGGTALLISSVDAVRDAVPRAIIPAAGAAFVSLGTLVVFAVLAPEMLWIPVASVLVGGLGASWLAARADRRATAIMAEHDDWLSRRLGVLYRAAPDLAGGGASARAVGAFADEDARFGRALRQAARSRGLGALVVVAAQAFAAAAVVVQGQPGGEGGVPLEATAALALLMVALIDPFIALLDAVPQARAWRENEARLRAALADADAPDTRRPREYSEPLAGLGARELVLAYPSGPAIGPITSFSTPGAWTLITGPSGSGKSTYLDALAGFKAPDAGQIVTPSGRHSAHAPDAWVPATALGTVTWCPQDAYVFDAPVDSNLRLAREDLTDAEIRDALSLVGLGDMDPSRPAGPGGSWLSGGERQRLSVARGLVRGADVFLLDEPTAHLDHDGAARLVADLGEALRGRTVIVVAHGDFAQLAPNLPMARHEVSH